MMGDMATSRSDIMYISVMMWGKRQPSFQLWFRKVLEEFLSVMKLLSREEECFLFLA